MCYYLLISIQGAKIGSLPPLPRGFRKILNSNQSLSMIGDEGNSFFLVEGESNCSCSLIPKPETGADTDIFERLKKRYRKKNWSEAKVLRVVESLKKMKEKRYSGHSDSNSWSRNLLEYLNMVIKDASKVSIFLHDFSDVLQLEMVEIEGQGELVLANLTKTRMKENIVYALK